MTIRKRIGLTVLSLVLLVVAAVFAIKLRGFRASSNPSSFETAVARALRNLSIPPGESHKKNPYTGDEVALQHGRDMFLARCVGCHGTVILECTLNLLSALNSGSSVFAAELRPLMSDTPR